VGDGEGKLQGYIPILRNSLSEEFYNCTGQVPRLLCWAVTYASASQRASGLERRDHAVNCTLCTMGVDFFTAAMLLTMPTADGVHAGLEVLLDIGRHLSL